LAHGTSSVANEITPRPVHVGQTSPAGSGFASTFGSALGSGCGTLVPRLCGLGFTPLLLWFRRRFRRRFRLGLLGCPRAAENAQRPGTYEHLLDVGI
jgi:hypothetical protein